MSDDRPGPPGDERADDPALDSGREAAVRRLLADARESEPIPPDVAARLDETLAGLGRSKEPGGSANVVPLRRRRLRRVLVAAAAAAAVAVVAVPVTMSLTDQGEDGASTSATSESAPESGAGSLEPSGPGSPTPQGEPLAGDRSRAQPAPSSGAPPGGELLLSRDEFDAQVAALVVAGGRGPVPADRCGAPGGGRTIAVSYDGSLGTLRLVPDGDAVLAQLYLCGRNDVVRASAVPVR